MPQTRIKKLKQIFPADDPLSNLVYRLTVVREDLVMEALLILEDKLPSIDRGDKIARQGYVMRRHILSLHTAIDIFRQEGKLIQEIIANPSDKEQKKVAVLLEKARKVLNKQWNQFSAWRNDMGGHISQKQCARILEDFAELDGPVTLEANAPKGNALDDHWRMPYRMFFLGQLPEGFDLRDEKAGRKFFKDTGKLLASTMHVLIPALDAVIRHQVYRMRAWQ